jgi:hypothetical protein
MMTGAVTTMTVKKMKETTMKSLKIDRTKKMMMINTMNEDEGYGNRIRATHGL